jgi:Mrp family chromosome partitioning ATPase
VKPLPGDAEPASARPEPLRIDYSTTRVISEARVQLLRTPGVVRFDGSPLSEAFRLLRSQVGLRMRAEGLRLVGVTSPRRIPGKSLTTANLALAMAAELNTAVLLVDAELGGLGVQSLFGLGDEAGLIEHLTRGVPVADLLINPGVERLVLLTAGRESVNNSAELLAGQGLQHLMSEMKDRYHDRIIVVDLPPLLDSADAVAMLPHVDTTMMVVEESAHPIRDLEAANELLAPFQVLGTVLAPASPAPARKRWFSR